ncbi:phage tail sheath subtilisin-like domain-containing protein [Tepidicaulis sp. LMO-SS28]|uniref:phage tail sheath subtilisin-like domain-containing protein n=1 Tax=Tepidicaulis sp. LMO-SS28 TaxID=3447455 RepID=UPI003EE2E7EA
MAETFLHGVEVIEIDEGIRPIQTVRSSVIGLIGTAPDAVAGSFPVNTPVLLANEPRKAVDLGETGTLKDAVDAIYDQAGAMIVIVRVEEGVDTTATMSNIVGDSALGTGVHAFLSAENEVKVTPRILCAPGFTGDRPDDLANPVVSELIGIADKLRATIVAEGPNTTAAEAITWREDWGSSRLYVVDPAVKVWDTTLDQAVVQPNSARVAGMIARRDNERGFWWSPSNQVMNGIVGTARAIGFNLSDANSEANLLNENAVATIVQKDGYRLWGNRTCSDDPLWAFLSVRRTADMVYESVERSFLWAMDRPLSAQLVLDIQDSVQAYLNSLKARGAILGGTVWLDPELNTPSTLMAGELYLDFDIEPPAPMERLTFRAHRNSGYYEELVDQVLEAA